MSILWINLAALIVYISAWFVVGRKLNRLDVADTAWGGGFVLVAALSWLHSRSVASALIFVLTAIWGLRLASHIWRRNRSKGPDPRYEALSATWKTKSFWTRAFFSIFITQALLIFVVALPISVSAVGSVRHISWTVLIGLLVWLYGFTIEAIADRQLARFVRLPENKGTVLQTGLWHYSRHPNYFGEITLWWGIGIIALAGGHGWISWWSLIGPALLTYLIVFVSGIPTIEKRYADRPDYQAYKRKTSALLLLPRRK